MVAILGADGDEIEAVLGIIVAFETNRSPMMNVWVVFHNVILTSPLMSLGNRVSRSFSRVRIWM